MPAGRRDGWAAVRVRRRSSDSAPGGASPRTLGRTCTRTSRSSRPGSPEVDRDRSTRNRAGAEHGPSFRQARFGVRRPRRARVRPGRRARHASNERSPRVRRTTSPPRSEVEHGTLDEARRASPWAGDAARPGCRALARHHGRRARRRRLNGGVASGEAPARPIEDVVSEARAGEAVGDVGNLAGRAVSEIRRRVPDGDPRRRRGTPGCRHGRRWRCAGRPGCAARA